MNSPFMRQPVQAKPVSVYLKEQEQLLGDLGALLKSERIALRHRDIATITALSERKSQLMVQLQGNDQKIRLNPQAALLKTAFASRVRGIKDALCGCKRLNEINGRLSMLLLTSTRRAAGVLMQVRDSATMNLTYNDKGTTQARGPVRLSIEA